jgi:hypothetical protein
MCSAATIAFMCSCGPQQPALFPVRGRVVDAARRPAAHALVVFHPVDAVEAAGVRPSGRVDESGNFRMTTREADDGAPTGTYVITVFWQRPQTNPFDGDGPDILAGRYNNPAESRLRFTVEPKASNVVPEITVQIAPGAK